MARPVPRTRWTHRIYPRALHSWSLLLRGPQATALVTNGIYSRIRNPIYVSGIVCITGAFLMLQQPYLWIVLFLIITGQIIRARREARVLEAAFGDAYREYRRHTWF